MATIVDLMAHYTPVYYELPEHHQTNTSKDNIDKYLNMLDHMEYIKSNRKSSELSDDGDVTEILHEEPKPDLVSQYGPKNYKIPKVTGTSMQRAVKVANYLHQNGNFTKEQAAAIAGVMIDENGVDPSSYMKAEKAGKGAAGTGGFGYGAGIGSWTGEKFKNELLKAGGYKPYTPIESLSLEEQAKLLVIDSNGRMKRYYDALRRTGNIEDASSTAVLITGGVGYSKNWNTHPTAADAKRMSDIYGRSNDRRFGKSANHWNLDVRRLAYARQVLQQMG